MSTPESLSPEFPEFASALDESIDRMRKLHEERDKDVQRKLEEFNAKVIEEDQIQGGEQDG